MPTKYLSNYALPISSKSSCTPPLYGGGVRIRIFWNPDLDLMTRGRPQEGCWAIHSIKYQNSQKSLFFQILQKYVENAIMRHTPSQIVGKMLPNRFGSDFRHIVALFLNSSKFSKFWKIYLHYDHMAHPPQIVGKILPVRKVFKTCRKMPKIATKPIW